MARVYPLTACLDDGHPDSQTLEALPGIIDDLRAQGSEFTTVPKLVAPGK